MSIREPHTLSFRNPGVPPEELDTLLRSFFRSELPDPWPALQAPSAASCPAVAPAQRWTGLRSRVALAASVALLLLGSWCFSARTPDYSMTPQGNGVGVGSASNTPIYRGGFKLQAPAAETGKGKTCGGCCGNQ